MPEEKFKQLYSYLKDNDLTDLDESNFKQKYSDINKAQELHSYLKNEGMTDLDINSFHNEYFGSVKKKEDTQSTSELLTEPFASGTNQQENKKPSESSGSESDIYSFDDKSEFKLSDEGKWLKKPKGKTLKTLEGSKDADGNVILKAEEDIWKPVNEASRVAILNKKFNKQGLTGSGAYVGFPGKEENEYKNDTLPDGTNAWLVRRKGQTDFTVISDAGSINALNKQFGKNIKPSDIAKQEREGQIKAKQDAFESSKKYSFVNDELLTKSEEEIVPYLKETFNKNGVGDIFEVEQIGAGYDAMKITNRYTGESREISLQNWSNDRNNSEAKILKSFIQVNTYKPELYRKKKQLQELEQNFDNTDYLNIVENTKKLNTLKQEVKESEKDVNRFAKTSGDLKSATYSKSELENTKNKLASNSFRVIEYKEKVKEYNSFNDEIQKGLNDGTITQEQYLSTWKPQLDDLRNGLDVEKTNLSEVRNEAKQRSEDLNEMMGEYIDVQKDRGNFLTGTAKNFVEGYGSVMDFLIAPKGKEGEVKQAFSDAISPGMVSKEYLSNEDRSWFEQAIGGLANSIGASAATPGISLAGLYASSYQNMKEQMNTPEFEGVPEYEKIIMSTIYGGVISGMEKFGLDKVFSKSPAGSKITNYLFSSVVKELPKNASKEMIETAIDKSLKNAIAKRIINVSGGMITEGVTEGAQDIAEGGLKIGYNKLKEKDYFETPKTAIEFWKGVGKSTLLGMVGAGAIQGVIQSASLLNKGVDVNSIQSIDALTKDETLKEIVVAKVQNDVLSGEKTKEEGKEILDNINNAVSTVNKIPDNLSNEDKATSFNLIKEREDIEKEISGKDDALIAPQKERIQAINEELTNISKDAVQKQATDESVLRTEQSKMGLREVEQANAQQEIVTEEGKQEEVVEQKINEKIDEYESNQATEIGSTETDTDPTTEKKGARTKHGRFSKQAREEKHARVRKALSVETYDLNDLIRKYFVKGGKIKANQVAQELYGNKKDKKIKGEWNRLFHLHNKNGLSIKGLAQKLWEEHKQFVNENITDQDWRNAIENFINGDVSTEGMINSLLGKSQEEVIDAEAKYWEQSYDPTIIEGYDESELMDAEDVLDSMTDEEIIQMANDIEQSEKEFAETKTETSYEEVKSLDTKDPTNLKKVQSFIDKTIKNLDDFSKESTSMGIALPVAKKILQAIKVLVDAGVSLQDALSQVAKDNNVTELDIVDAIEKVQNAQKPTDKSRAAKEISKRDKTKVTVNEYESLIKQIKLEAIAGKQAQRQIKDVIEVIKDLFDNGSITKRQYKALSNRILKTNFDKQQSINDLINYSNKVFKRADYVERISEAKDKISKIKKNITSKTTQDTVKVVMKEFIKINPELLSDAELEQYNELLDKAIEATKTSKVTGKLEDAEMNLKVATELSELSDFTEVQLEKQEQIRKNNLLEMYSEYVEEGIINEKMSIEEIMDIIDGINKTDDAKNYDIVREKLINKIESIKSIIEYLITNNKDPFTDENVAYSNNTIDTITRALSTNLSDTTLKELTQIYEAFDNFVVNGIVDNLDNIIPQLQGVDFIKNEFKNNGQTRQLNTFLKLKGTSKKIARITNSYLANMSSMMEKKFPGVLKTQKFLRGIGFADIVDGNNKAITQRNKKVDEYLKKFKDTKPNGTEFQSAKNDIERGVYAFLIRNIQGSEVKQNKEFKRRVRLVIQSRDALIDSTNNREVMIREALSEVIDKLGLENENISVESISKNVDSINKEAVNWWINEWASVKPELDFISQSVYNQVLGTDINYIPDSYKRKISAGTIEEQGLLEKKGGFISLTTDRESVGVLKKAIRPNSLSEDMYISFSFDANNANIYKAALIDINTAVPIRKFYGATKSKSWNDVMGTDDGKVLKDRMNKYISAIKGKTFLSTAEEKEMLSMLGVLSKYSVGRALGGSYTTFLKQTVPVIMNTFVNTGFNASHVFTDLAKTRDWIAKTGMPIANRGEDAALNIDSVEGKLDRELDGKKGKIIDGLDKVTGFYLKYFLTNADTLVARGSFLSFYIQNLKRKGVDFSYDAEMDQESLEYAQSMVDRQQQVSDKNLQGEMFNSKSFGTRLAAMTFLPFANFQLNLKSRIYADIITLKSKTSTKEDRNIAYRSLIGTSAEILTFNALAALFWSMSNEIANSFFDDDEDKDKKKEEDVKADYKIGSMMVTNSFKDIISPLPLLDDAIIGLTKATYGWIAGDDIKLTKSEQAQFDELLKEKEADGKLNGEQRSQLLEDFKKNREFGLNYQFRDDWSSYGALGAGLRAKEDIPKAYNGLFSKEIETESYGEKKTFYVRDEDDWKRKMASLGVFLHLIGIAPSEIRGIANKINKKIEKRAYTEKQHNDLEYAKNKEEIGKNKINQSLGENGIKIFESKHGKGKAKDETYKTIIEKEGVSQSILYMVADKVISSEEYGRMYKELKIMKEIGKKKMDQSLDENAIAIFEKQYGKGKADGITYKSLVLKQGLKPVLPLMIADKVITQEEFDRYKALTKN